MVKVNIISGFLGAGKTTLIKKLLGGKVREEKIILLENEYGEVGVDGSFMKDAGITVTEMNSGCICCTLVGDFQKAVDELIEKYHPDRLIIEPSGGWVGARLTTGEPRHMGSRLAEGEPRRAACGLRGATGPSDSPRERTSNMAAD